MSTSFVALALEGMALEPRVRVARLGSVTRSVHLFLGAGVRNDATRPSAMPSFEQSLHIQVISLRTTATRCQKLPSGLQVLVEGSASCAPFAPTKAAYDRIDESNTLHNVCRVSGRNFRPGRAPPTSAACFHFSHTIPQVRAWLSSTMVPPASWCSARPWLARRQCRGGVRHRLCR